MSARHNGARDFVCLTI